MVKFKLTCVFSRKIESGIFFAALVEQLNHTEIDLEDEPFESITVTDLDLFKFEILPGTLIENPYGKETQKNNRWVKRSFESEDKTEIKEIDLEVEIISKTKLEKEQITSVAVVITNCVDKVFSPKYYLVNMPEEHEDTLDYVQGIISWNAVKGYFFN